MHAPQQGRIALVTGATQGIGAAIARRLAREGATVGVNGLTHDERMRAVVAQTAGFPAVGDISDPDAVARLVDDIETTHGPIDILVCNAAYMTMAPFVDARRGGLVEGHRHQPGGYVLSDPGGAPRYAADGRRQYRHHRL